jgi:hypothetical protein
MLEDHSTVEVQPDLTSIIDILQRKWGCFGGKKAGY